MVLLRREAHSAELPTLVGSARGDKKVGKREAWTPQPMMCGTQVATRGSSLGENTGPENEGKFTELADQLQVEVGKYSATLAVCVRNVLRTRCIVLWTRTNVDAA